MTKTLPARLRTVPKLRKARALHHAKRAAILERIGLDAQSLARGIVEDVTALTGSHPPLDVDQPH